MPLRKRALTARPERSSATTPDRGAPLLDPPCASAKTSPVETTPPRQAKAGSSQGLAPRWSAEPRTKQSAAPNAAPLEVPTRPGSTIGLRNSACISVPPTPRAAPTSRQRRARGTRSSEKIRSSRVAPLRPGGGPQQEGGGGRPPPEARKGPVGRGGRPSAGRGDPGGRRQSPATRSRGRRSGSRPAPRRPSRQRAPPARSPSGWFSPPSLG